MKPILAATAAAMLAIAGAAPALAQDADNIPGDGDTVFDDKWLSIGVGAVYSPSYSGSDDYVVSPIPIVQGRVGDFSLNPRAGGAALSYAPQNDSAVDFTVGVVGKISRNRASQIEDTVVEMYGEFDTAIEVGPTVGVSLSGVLNQYDSLSFNLDALWDVAGAHRGMTFSPGVTYFTPLSRGTAVSLSFGATHVDDDYADYYYSVPQIATLLPANTLPAFQADGGFEKVSVNLLAGVDLNGNLADGGLALIFLGGYSRLLGDAKRSPFTSIRGDADQWMGALGIGYTF